MNDRIVPLPEIGDKMAVVCFLIRIQSIHNGLAFLQEIDRAQIFTWNLQQAGHPATVCRPLDQHRSHFPTFCWHIY